MRKPGLLAVLLATVVLSVPGAAHAATYDPVRWSDGVGDATDPNGGSTPGPSKPAIDITDSKANVTAERFKITVAYLGLKAKPYVRYVAGVIDPNLGQGTVVELRASGTSTKAVLYKATADSGESFTLKRLTCAGFSARADYAARTITFTIPMACYKGRLATGSGFIVDQAYAWTPDTWQNGDLVLAGDTTAYAADDAFMGWVWDASAARRGVGDAPRALTLR